ncbi:MAG TPA: helix-turn-helix domain-containing protein [Rhodanobacteraceae bacterium]|nr:helix-turn-helix domain-containing protein [Rhodanobacteraceae bacterium]
MTPTSTYLATERPLDALGISADEERAYVALLDHPEATLAELSSALAWPARKVQRLLDALKGMGLVTFAAGEPRRFVPASPDIAIEAILSRREGELRRARAEIQRLQQRASEGAGRRRQIIELVTTPEAERHVFEQIQRAARHELIFLARPPILIAGPEQPSETQVDAIARGVRYRSIADQAFLALPGVLGRIRADMEAGEEVRVVPALPFKMVMADRSVALIPLNLESPNSPSLLVRSSALLDALYSMFELLWERAAPIAVTRAGTLETGAPGTRLPADADQLLSLLAAGLNDKAIAYELGISASTLTRRITEIMHRLDAETRFQLGWLAAKHESERAPTADGNSS